MPEAAHRAGGDDDLVGLLQAVIRHPTEDPPGREIELARYVHAWLEARGVSSAIDEFAPGRANVLGRVAGAGALPALVFSAHLDTMPAGEGEWTHAPFAGEIADGRVYGRGAADMKGGLAAMMEAARRVAADAAGLRGDLLLALSAGESSRCLGARRFVSTGVLAGAGAMLVSEPSGLRVLVAEKGALWLRLTAAGRPGHASGAEGSSGAGDNAIVKLVDALERLRATALPGEAHPLLGRASLAIGTIRGGRAVNLTPDAAEAEVDIRYPPSTDAQTILEAVRAAAGGGVGLEVIDDKPPLEVSADHPFVTACLEACRGVLGDVPAPGGVSYFSDANVLCPALGIPRAIIGPGALGMSGQRDEHVEIAKLEAAAEIFERLARRWLR